MENKARYEPDRRAYRRYAIGGSLSFDSPEMRFKGELLDLSLGGLRFRAERLPEVGATGTLQLSVDGFHERIVATIRIVRAEENVVGALFVVPSVDLVRCITWLAAKDLPGDAA